MPLSRCAKCQRYCRMVTTFLFSHIGLCALVVGYSIIGAFTFEALEAGHERLKRDDMIKERENVVTGLWSITAESSVLSEQNWTALALETLQDFEVTLVRAVRKEGYDGKDESPLQWTFSGALLYSIIVITTIGYGNIAPKTPWGKVVTILYAIVGIPLLLLCLSNIGDAMAHSFKFLYWKVCCILCVRPRKRRKRTPLDRQYRLQPPVAPLPAICRSPAAGESPRSPPSSSTYHTAASCSSSLVSSPTHSPRHDAPGAASKHVVSLDHPSAVDYYGNSAAPVITNKYALQDDGPRVTYTSPVFTIFGGSGGGCRFANPNQECRKNGRPGWLPNSYNHSGETAGIDSVRDLSPTSDDDDGDEEEVSVPMWLCVALVVGYICGGAVLFTFWEKWDFLDSSYFCFVTLTTIGLGDLVPGSAVISDDNQATLGLCSLYLLFGMALLAMSFNLVQEEVTRSMRCIGRRIGILADDEDD